MLCSLSRGSCLKIPQPVTNSNLVLTAGFHSSSWTTLTLKAVFLEPVIIHTATKFIFLPHKSDVVF